MKFLFIVIICLIFVIFQLYNVERTITVFEMFWCRVLKVNVKVSMGKGKGKVHRCTGTEALYRSYGP